MGSTQPIDRLPGTQDRKDGIRSNKVNQAAQAAAQNPKLKRPRIHSVASTDSPEITELHQSFRLSGSNSRRLN